MHGRVKVRTSAEEKARKERERQEKLKVFKYAMNKILQKRKEGENDHEQLELTEKVLSSNPDIYTLWNIRREIIIHLRNNKENDDDLTKLYDSELKLTEYCLKINPKSYCAWHQRKWILTERPDPDWQKELSLCDQYLKLDERNFHTWHYRVFVVSQCKPPLKQEFDFTTEKLYDNFSNYSAWHYRSKMLLQLYPDVEGGRPIQDSYHKHELKMVQSAAFTDPDDTSAWFYQRWLLGAVKASIQPVVCTVTPNKTTVAWNKCVPRDYIETKTRIIFDNVTLSGEWYSSTNFEHDDLWIFKHDKEVTDSLDIKVEFTNENEEISTIVCTKYEPVTYVGKNDINFQNKYSKPVFEELIDQLDSCRQLLALEPDNRWTLLTLTFFLHCVDATQYDQEIMTNLHKLKELDPLRAGYYSDLISKWSIEQQLVSDYTKNELSLNIKCKEIISTLPHLQYYSHCKTVGLSNQNLTSRFLPSLIKLQHCEELNLSNNNLTTLRGFPSLPLKKLYLNDNSELNKEEIEQFKEKNQAIEIFY